MYCTTKTLKYILIVFNLLLALLGALLLWFGTWLLSNNAENNAVNQDEYLAAILVIVLAVVLLVITIFGCVATYTESKLMLIGYAVVLVVLLVMQLILVSISYAAGNEGLSAGLKDGFDELFDKNDERINSTLSFYEDWLHCCGKNSAEDYILMDKIPSASCCKERDCTNVLNLYLIGCDRKFKEYIHTKSSNFNVLSGLLIVTEFIGSILACVLVDSIRNHRDRRRLYN